MSIEASFRKFFEDDPFAKDEDLQDKLRDVTHLLHELEELYAEKESRAKVVFQLQSQVSQLEQKHKVSLDEVKVLSQNPWDEADPSIKTKENDQQRQIDQVCTQ